MVIVENRSNAPVVLELTHDVVCSRTGACTCETVYNPAEPKPVPKRKHHTIRILPGSCARSVPTAAKLLPQVIDGIHAGVLAVRDAPAQVEELR